MNGIKETLLWNKWLYWKNGIPAHQFWQEDMRDIQDILDINNAIKDRELRQKELNKLINKVR